MKREKERKSNGESASDREIYLKKKKKKETKRNEIREKEGKKVKVEWERTGLNGPLQIRRPTQ